MLLYTVLILCVGIIHGKNKFPNLPKCALKDQECLRKLYENVVHSIGETGLPELGIPPVDPIELKNVTVSVFGLLDITLIKGIATGVKNCVFEKFTLDLKKESGYQETVCSIKVEGRYSLRSNNPLIKDFVLSLPRHSSQSTLDGSSYIYGEGNGKATIDKVHIAYDLPIYAQKRSDGEIYMYCDPKKITYKHKVLGGAKFFGDDIHIGDQEISKEVIPLLNENWKFIMSAFGKPFIDKAMEFYFDFAGKFFNVVPARYYILDDLTPYARP